MEKFRSFIKKHLVISIIISVIIYPLLIIWPIVYFDKIVKHKKLLYLGILLFFIFIISGIKSVKNNTSTEYDYDACEHYANILINNTKNDNGSFSNIDETKYELYRDSLQVSFNKLSDNDKVVMFDNYLETSDTAKYAFCSNVNIGEIPLNKNPYDYDLWLNACREYIYNILSAHHFDTDEADITLTAPVRLRVWEPNYVIRGTVKYKNLFNATVTNEVAFLFNRHGDMLKKEIY